MMGELKPCLWCRTAEHLSVSTWNVQPDNWYSGHVTCGNCDARGPGPGEWLHSEDEAAAEAIAAWNRRPDAPSAGEGWVLVPVEPDGAMKMAGCAAPRSEATRNATNTLERQMETTADIYRAMVAMAPAPPQADGGEG